MTKTASSTGYDWIDALCRQFSEASNWPLHFYRGTARGRNIPSAAEPGSPDHCWSRVIEDGERSVGTLYLDLPHQSRRDSSFRSVSALAEVFADLVKRLVSAGNSLEARSNQISTLVNIGRSIPREQDLPNAINQLLRAAIQLTDFRSAGFFLLNPTTNELKMRVSQDVDLQQIPFLTRELADNPPDLMALTRGQTLLRRDASNDDGAWLPGDMATGLCVAVQSDAGPIGTLWAFDRRLRTPDDREIHVVQSIAAQVAVLLERVVLLRESVAQHRLQRDLAVASQCQCPEMLSEVIGNLNFDAAAVCASRYELGGDLCDLIPLDSCRTVIAVGDASGDSVPAAMVMSAVRGALRTLSSYEIEDVLRTDVVMRRINRALHDITPPQQFMSLLYGVLDTADRSFTYTNAGHPTPIRLSGEKISTFDSHGMLLGVMADATYKRSVLKLDPGDTLVFYSDGISEAMNGRRKLFRSEGIAGAIKGQSTGSADEILQTIWSQLEAHTGDDSDADDRTLLVVRMPGAVPASREAKVAMLK